jgi:hypothetical protein
MLTSSASLNEQTNSHDQTVRSCSRPVPSRPFQPIKQRMVTDTEGAGSSKQRDKTMSALQCPRKTSLSTDIGSKLDVRSWCCSCLGFALHTRQSPRMALHMCCVSKWQNHTDGQTREGWKYSSSLESGTPHESDRF